MDTMKMDSRFHRWNRLFQYLEPSGTRRPNAREVSHDGETIRASDLLGIFNNDHEINEGDYIEIDGVRHVASDARPVQAVLVSPIVQYCGGYQSVPAS
ncbi:hypothetical protein vBSsoS008_037 [Shigella phage vB_SsoS_008]|nr:hypothetical protein vBSsoS008_037 [Shigella phage vB_SsoS_008]